MGCLGNCRSRRKRGRGPPVGPSDGNRRHSDDVIVGSTCKTYKAARWSMGSAAGGVAGRRLGQTLPTLPAGNPNFKGHSTLGTRLAFPVGQRGVSRGAHAKERRPPDRGPPRVEAWGCGPLPAQVARSHVVCGQGRYCVQRVRPEKQSRQIVRISRPTLFGTAAQSRARVSRGVETGTAREVPGPGTAHRPSSGTLRAARGMRPTKRTAGPWVCQPKAGRGPWCQRSPAIVASTDRLSVGGRCGLMECGLGSVGAGDGKEPGAGSRGTQSARRARSLVTTPPPTRVGGLFLR